MNSNPNKKTKLTRGTSSAVLLSILIHAALFLLAGMLVVFTVTKVKEAEFEAPKAVERPKMKLRKPKVQIKKSKPPSTARIMTKRNMASMPNIKIPELSDMGDGLLGGPGGDGFELMIDLNDAGLFGGSHSIGNDFTGTFYDFKRDRNGRPIPYALETYRDIVRAFIKGGWKTSRLARYYQSPRKLYSTTFIIPTVLSEIAPRAFGEMNTEGNFWMVHYVGQLVHKDGITFRFLGSGDEILLVRVDGEIVFGSAWWFHESQILGDIWQSTNPDSKKYWMGNQTATTGDWITLEPGVPLDMEVIMTDNGGQACLMLAVEEKGVEYERSVIGGPIFPAFKTAMPSHSLLDAIYKDLVPGEVTLTNGPVFNDYGTPPPVTVRDPNGTGAAVELAVDPAVDDSGLRTWSYADGKAVDARFVLIIGDKIVLETAKGQQLKIPFSQLSAEDRTYAELASPPELSISFSSGSTPVFSIIEGSSSGQVMAYEYRCTARLKQEGTRNYNHELKIDLFAIGKEIYGDKFVLLDRQTSRFTPTDENNRSHQFSGTPVELPNFILESIHRGLEPHGHLITVTDSRGIIIAHDASNEWLYENLENLKHIPVGAYMDKTCTRTFPTSPPRTRY